MIGILLAVSLFGIGMLATGGTLINEGHRNSPAQVSDSAQGSAEERVANYTLALAWLTGVLAVSTIGLWVYAGLTLKHSREASENELRPYLNITGATFEWGVGGVRITLECLNSGKSPATFFDIGCTSAIRTGAEELPRAVPASLEYKTWTALGAGRLETIGFRKPEFAENARSVMNPTPDKTFLLLGRVRYGDIFGNEYETEFIYFTKSTRPTQPIKMSRSTGRLKTYQKIKG